MALNWNETPVTGMVLTWYCRFRTGPEWYRYSMVQEWYPLEWCWKDWNGLEKALHVLEWSGMALKS